MNVNATLPVLNAPSHRASSSTAATGLATDPPRKNTHRPSTMVRSLQRGETRRRSFLDDLQQQMLQHEQEDLERERYKEVLNLHRILQRPPDTRDANDIDTLYEWVMRNGSTSKIFQGAQEIICKTICREMTLLELPAHGVVCYQGDYGDVFFIIISGSVSLYVETKKKLLPTHGSVSGSMTPSEDKRLDRLHALQARDEDTDSTDEFKPEMFGSFIKQIGAGGTFGEVAVMDPTARRSCTIVCDSATSFICLKRAAYQRLIRITNSSQLDFTQVEFLETLYFFDRWPHSELMRVSNRLRHMTFAADSYLARVGAEANVMFFIYSGMVQESIPVVHHLNENGNVYKCTTLESDAAMRSTLADLTLAERKQKQQRRRVALELNICVEHDVCGELPIVLNRASSNTDLLAITDVKALILDRETWKEVFFMHGLDHVKASHHRFRQLTQARENWRQTRLKLALANPGIRLTLSTKAMMLDGKCMCGWCGSAEHITGDMACPALMASKQRQADEQKKKRDKEKGSPMGKKAAAAKHALGAGAGDAVHVKTIKNTVTFVNQMVEMRKASALAEYNSSTPGQAPAPLHRSTTPRKSTLKAVAARIMSEISERHARPETASDSPPPSAGPATQPAPVVQPLEPSMQSPQQQQQHGGLYEVYRSIETHAKDDEKLPLSQPANSKVDDVRKSAFTDEVEAQYRHELVRQTKRIANVEQYYQARAAVLEQVQHEGSGDASEHVRKLPRKPKIPKPSTRLAMCSKNREPRPDRFNRKINRVLKKMWAKDHPIPVVEESLRDS